MWAFPIVLALTAASPPSPDPLPGERVEPDGPSTWQLGLSSVVGAGVGGLAGGAVGWVAGFLIATDFVMRDEPVGNRAFGSAAAITVGASAGGLVGGILGPTLLFGESSVGAPVGGALGGGAGAAAAAFPAASMLSNGLGFDDLIAGPLFCASSPFVGCAGAACGAASGAVVEAGIRALSEPQKPRAAAPALPGEMPAVPAPPAEMPAVPAPPAEIPAPPADVPAPPADLPAPAPLTPTDASTR
jgi:hypothetical protein